MKYYCENCIGYHEDNVNYVKVIFTKEFAYLILIALFLIGIGVLIKW